MEPCPLCHSSTEPFAEAHGRAYRHCAACDLVSLERKDLPSPVRELERYHEHNNSPDDPRYRAFLCQLADEVCPFLAPGARGLDYGSGPQPVMGMILAERGFPTVSYDPVFAPKAALLGDLYAFIVCSETAEHFHRPAEEFARLSSLIEPGGVFGVMTKMLDRWEPGTFVDWHYPRDVTHVSFYSRKTMMWIAGRLGWQCEFPRPHVTIFHTPAAPPA